MWKESHPHAYHKHPKSPRGPTRKHKFLVDAFSQNIYMNGFACNDVYMIRSTLYVSTNSFHCSKSTGARLAAEWHPVEISARRSTMCLDRLQGTLAAQDGQPHILQMAYILVVHYVDQMRQHDLCTVPDK